MSTDYFRFFPSTIGKALRVSEFDAVVLSGFSPKSWRRLLALFSSERLRKHPVLLNHGDLLPLLRLDAWAMPRPLPVLLRHETGEERAYTRYECQLTGHGVRVLSQGFGSIGWGPPPNRPWVARETRDGWKLRPV